MKITWLACSFFVLAATAQETVEIKAIKIDYNTRSFVDSKIFKTLKANDWVQISIINLPNDIVPTAVLNSSNRNLDLRSSFQSYIEFNRNNPYNNDAANTSQPTDVAGKIKENDDLLLKNKNEIKAEIKKTDPSVADKTVDKNLEKIAVNTDGEKKYKIDESNMIEALEVGVAANYLNKLKKTPEVENAIKDIQVQQQFIKYLQENIIDKLKFRQNLASNLGTTIDALNKEVKTITTITYYFPPVKIENSDFSEFIVSMKDKDNNIQNIKMPFNVKRGFKLDFSTGFVFNGLYNGNYKLIQYDDNNVVIKEEDSKNGFNFNTGIALLAHAYTRKGSFLNYGVSSGLSFNLNNQNLNYMLGLSALFGEDQRFIVTFGLTAGRVKDLVKYYKLNKPIPANELPVTSQVPTVERLKATWFLGVTYNLGSAASSKATKI